MALNRSKYFLTLFLRTLWPYVTPHAPRDGLYCVPMLRRSLMAACDLISWPIRPGHPRPLPGHRRQERERRGRDRRGVRCVLDRRRPLLAVKEPISPRDAERGCGPREVRLNHPPSEPNRPKRPKTPISAANPVVHPCTCTPTCLEPCTPMLLLLLLRLLA